MSTIADLRKVRLEQLEKIKKLGLNPYPAESKKDYPNKEILDNFEDLEGKSANITGRITSIREHGALVFIDLADESGVIQLYIREDTLKATDLQDQILGFDHISLLGTGDFIQAFGEVTKTKSGQISLKVESLKLLSKSLRPIPEELKDIEERYRKRYLDFLLNPRSKEILDTRWKIEEETRKFLWNQGFKEVETPILQTLYGGTNAEPFTTHFNALNTDFYLRIAPELYLKRLIVGGYEKVFEIARNFRNEGIDQTHFPEFTMLEWYEAYADYHRVMDLAEALTKHLVLKLTGGTTIKVNDQEIDISGTWPRIPVEDLAKEHLGIEWDSIADDEIKDLLNKHKIQVAGVWDREKALFTLYDHLVTPKLIEPVWAIDYPQSVSPLSKAHRTKEKRAERFEGYIGGVEIFDGWSEIVSGLEQRRRFEVEQRNMKEGDKEAMPLDEEFIEALEYGCPPLGGIGFGIDRLVMFLTDTWGIKDVVAFPILKPRSDS
ncbi:lysine--tRNA ligase [candidate division WWE3 bacterium]|nr:lysine--tRNA ligase [candidate division WWE3 bacterium]